MSMEGTRSIEVWLVDLDQSARALDALEQAKPRLSDEDEQRIARFADPAQALRRRRAAIALRALIAAATHDSSLDRQPFRHRPQGKPVLENASIAFSISHAGSCSLIALAPAGVEVGVDLERKRLLHIAEDRRALLVQAARELTPEPLPGDGKADADGEVLHAWVRLEALAKARGCGIGRVLTEAGVLARGSGRAQQAASRSSPTAEAFPVLDLVIPQNVPGGPWYGALASTAGTSAAAEVRLLPAEFSSLQAFTDPDSRR